MGGQEKGRLGRKQRRRQFLRHQCLGGTYQMGTGMDVKIPIRTLRTLRLEVARTFPTGLPSFHTAAELSYAVSVWVLYDRRFPIWKFGGTVVVVAGAMQQNNGGLIASLSTRSKP